MGPGKVDGKTHIWQDVLNTHQEPPELVGSVDVIVKCRRLGKIQGTCPT